MIILLFDYLMDSRQLLANSCWWLLWSSDTQYIAIQRLLFWNFLISQPLEPFCLTFCSTYFLSSCTADADSMLMLILCRCWCWFCADSVLMLILHWCWFYADAAMQKEEEGFTIWAASQLTDRGRSPDSRLINALIPHPLSRTAHIYMHTKHNSHMYIGEFFQGGFLGMKVVTFLQLWGLI